MQPFPSPTAVFLTLSKASDLWTQELIIAARLIRLKILLLVQQKLLLFAWPRQVRYHFIWPMIWFVFQLSWLILLFSGEEGPFMTNNSAQQPDWRSNYKGDYKGIVSPITTRDLLCYAFQVARGMEYLNSRKVRIIVL